MLKMHIIFAVEEGRVGGKQRGGIACNADSTEPIETYSPFVDENGSSVRRQTAMIALQGTHPALFLKANAVSVRGS